MQKIKLSTSVEYERRIKSSLTFITQNIDSSLQLEDVARASHFSAYHFHRIFHALVGETVNDYVSRKRMEKAALRLKKETSMNITEVAEAGGFSSNANFSKAFKLYFGISPSEFRKGNFNKNSNNGKLHSKYGKALSSQEFYSQFVTQPEVFYLDKLEDVFMDVNVKEFEERSIVYLTSDKGYELDSIFKTWDKIVNWGKSKGIGCERQTRFAICHDNPLTKAEEDCRYDAAIEAGTSIDTDSPYVRSTIPSGQYAVTYFKDKADKISPFIISLCAKWLPDSGYEPDDYPVIFNYLNDSRKDGFVEMNVYLKVKPLDLDV